MKIAVLGDLHLTDNFGSVKLSVLEWALQTAAKLECSFICCIGDLTAQGSDRQTEEILKRLKKCGIPFCSTPGNAELRLFPDGRNEAKFNLPPGESFPLILINTAKDEPAAEELNKLAALPEQAGFLLATHNPPAEWSPGAREILAAAQHRGAVTSVIAGHFHHDEEGILRGLDPDKASGGPPMFAVFERMKSGTWTRSDMVMPGVDSVEWTKSEREEFRRNLGFSTMRESVTALEFAALHQVQNVELRLHEAEYSNQLIKAVSKWRSRGGRILSLHLPDLTLRNDEGALEHYAAMALQLGCERVTLHVPRGTAAEFAPAQDILLEKFRKTLGNLLENNISIGIENLHTTPEKNTFETRNFGCNIKECRHWITLLRESFSTDLIGFHLDIGHCRNNAPISGRENLSDWYCSMGDLVNGWHLHQMTASHGKFTNHAPLKGWYEKLISLGGLFLALKAKQLKPAPMFLESRTWEGNKEAYLKLTEILSKD